MPANQGGDAMLRRGRPTQPSRIGALALAGLTLSGASARADQGGVSFWLPGQYASFAAVAPDPGWSLPVNFYTYSGSVGASRTLPRGKLVAGGLRGALDELFIVPTYTLDTTVLGARPSFSLSLVPAYASSSANVRLGSLSKSRATR